ncbi:hypothetical protein ASE14_15995 [Agromyces sp. Root81]|uniref:sugar kinase n=1 Tax=Agromyces sp. Root81 TaxID=1736601 RepID=UPI0006FCB5EB|nr:sugar kinase [Agromyces sp. Root81]KRC59262.1 hypothetical protein ASE14_15995 [Agromyces sp. Root81]
MIRAVAIGECMVELTRQDAGSVRLGFAGDTFNTAVYLKRLGGSGVEVRFVTATGDDELSGDQLASMRSEGLEVDAHVVPGASPALYLVSTDANGERTFTYYRDASPVRQLFDGPADERLTATIAEADLVYFSGVTLQMITDRARRALFEVLRAARERGGRIAFDSNYRARGWSSADTARAAMHEAMQVTDVALPSLTDERALHGGSAADVIDRYRSAGATEVVVKDGAGPVLAWADGRQLTVPGAPIARPVDTTGAGDSFNAGYLHARSHGSSVSDAVREGQRVAGVVITRRGAIVDREVLPHAP